MSNIKKVSYQRKCKICGNDNLKKVIKIQEQYLSPTFVKSNYKNPLTKIKTHHENPEHITISTPSSSNLYLGIHENPNITQHTIKKKHILNDIVYTYQADVSICNTFAVSFPFR